MPAMPQILLTFIIPGFEKNAAIKTRILHLLLIYGLKNKLLRKHVSIAQISLQVTECQFCDVIQVELSEAIT